MSKRDYSCTAPPHHLANVASRGRGSSLYCYKGREVSNTANDAELKLFLPPGSGARTGFAAASSSTCED
ncbi:hypothetical protein CCACVL1_03854 [Corchorus capsularis]|uniref:Uncharacterized protein n=1 Tax=Corchorus capsularis TaxID=210143 RepID=A0A1R3JXB7_COCAP|nr:hypothetical protein CCACVL1_03854 [Corchorus capsularis]